MGCSLAYHLAEEGLRDVVLLEKAELTSGSTWHAAGQVTRAVSSFGLGKCVDHSIDMYSGKLEQVSGQSVSWHGCGSIRVAYSNEEMDWFRHMLSVGRALQVAIELIDVEKIRQLHPFYNTRGIVGGIHTPDDGHVDPAGAAFAFAAAAVKMGVAVIQRCRVTSLARTVAGEWAVMTEKGALAAEHVVNAAGPWARQIGDWNELQLPMVSMTHHYFVTDSVDEFRSLSHELPVIRDDVEVSGYVRMEQQSGLIGIYEKVNANAVWEEGCPWDSEHELFEADYERVMPWLGNAMKRMPVLSQLGIKSAVHGAISHPPDGSPLLGPAFGVKNYWCCCGTQIGISWGPGLTRELARWIVHGSADISMREFDPRRFGPYADRKWQLIKAKEDYCLRHEIPYPHFNRLAGRPVKPSPLYEVLKSQGAVFEEVYGHERPRWFAANEVDPADQYAFTRNRIDALVAAEVSAVRKRCGVMDISAFAKVEIGGPDAKRALDKLSVREMDGPAGQICLTYLLNRRGRIEVEAIVAKLRNDQFVMICAPFYERRLLDHIRMHCEAMSIDVVNRSDAWAGLALQGPMARKVLGACTDARLDDHSFRRFSAQEINIRGHRIWALRLSYTGELGFELHGPRELMLGVYETLWEAGQRYQIINYGSFAMNVMRMEKGFKGASELTNEVTLIEAGVMPPSAFSAKEFVGRDAALIASDSPLPWLCAYLEIEPDGHNDGNGGEAVFHESQVVGSTTSIVFSEYAGTIVAFAYLDPAAAQPGTQLHVCIGGELRPAKVLATPIL